MCRRDGFVPVNALVVNCCLKTAVDKQIAQMGNAFTQSQLHVKIGERVRIESLHDLER